MNAVQECALVVGPVCVSDVCKLFILFALSCCGSKSRIGTE